MSQRSEWWLRMMTRWFSELVRGVVASLAVVLVWGVVGVGCNQEPPTDRWETRPFMDGGGGDGAADVDDPDASPRDGLTGDADGGVGGDAVDAEDVATECETREDCPTGSICARRWSDTPVCIDARPCRSHLMCPEGTMCLPRVDSDNGQPDGPRRCRPLGGATVGQACSHDTACRSGECRDGECAARCRTNAECPAGQLCHPDEGFCRPGECQTSCEDDYEFCTGEGGCVGSVCRRNADCGPLDQSANAGLSCVGAAGQPGTGFGSCRLSYRGPHCEPSSFRLHAGDPYCRRPTICDDEGDHEACPTSFFCAVNAKPEGGETLYMCGQQVLSAEHWPPEGE